MTRRRGPAAASPGTARPPSPSIAAACLLGAGCVVWASAPPVHKGFADFALFLAIFGVAAGALRLALAAVPVPEDSYLLPVPLRAWLRFLETLRLVPWEEGALIAVLWLEVLHPSRPWHTAVLGAALIAYLLATTWPSPTPPPRCSGRRSACWRRARACSRSARAPGCSRRPARERARRCCGWWRRARSSPRPASSCRTSRDSRGHAAPAPQRPGPCRDIQEGRRIPRSSLEPDGLRPGWAGGKMGLYAD